MVVEVVVPGVVAGIIVKVVKVVGMAVAVGESSKQ